MGKVLRDMQGLFEMVQVKLIGVPRIEDSFGELLPVRGQKPWAVLARVLLADRALTRRELSAELFPEAADPLGSLRWCLASLRKVIGSPDVLTGDPIKRELPEWVTVDVLKVRDGNFDFASVGELLEGIDPPCGPEFATWLLVARHQVAARLAALLREGIITALSRGHHERAIELAQLAARRAPYDEGAQILLVKSLVMAGQSQVALRHVAAVEALYREELACEPTPALRSAARSNMAAAPPGVSATAIAMSLLGSGRAAVSAGAIDAGLDCLRRAGAQAETAGDDALLGQCLLELGSALVHSVRGFDDEGCVLLEQAVHLARSSGDLPTAVDALRERGYADALAGRRPEARHHLDLAAELADGAPRLLAGVHAVAALNLSDWGRHEDALARYESAIDLARSVGDRRWVAWALGLGGWTALIAGRVPQALQWVHQCLDVVQSMQWASFEPWPMAVLAEARFADGNPSALPADLERCFAMSCQLEDPCWEGASGRVLALHYSRSGDSEQAVRWITEARTRALRKSDTWVAMIGTILLSEARIRHAAGDTSGADAAARELVGLAARANLDSLLQQGLSLITSSVR